MDLEKGHPMTPEELYGPYTQHYRFVIKVRWVIVAGWAVSMVAFAQAFGWWYEKSTKSAWVVLLMACLLSLALWIGERRNRKAIHRCRVALNAVEKLVVPEGIPRLLSGDIMANTCIDRVMSHGFWITAMMVGASLLCAVGAAYLALHGGRLP